MVTNDANIPYIFTYQSIHVKNKYSITSSVAANVPHLKDTNSDVATRHVVVYDYVQQNVTNTNKHVCTVHGINGFKCGVKQVRISSLTWPWNFMIFMTLKEIIFGVWCFLVWISDWSQKSKNGLFPTFHKPFATVGQPQRPPPTHSPPGFWMCHRRHLAGRPISKATKQKYISKTWILWFFVRDS